MVRVFFCCEIRLYPRPINIALNTYLFTKMELTNPYKVPASEIESRRLKIQQELRQNDIDGLFIVQRVDLFYFSGTAQNGYMYIPAEGQPTLVYQTISSQSRKRVFRCRYRQNRIDKRNPAANCRPAMAACRRYWDTNWMFCRSTISGSIKAFLRCKKSVDGSPHILKVRRIKSDWEIAQMENTAEMTAKTFEYMRTAIRPGLSEMEFAGMFETYARRLGHGAGIRVRHYQTEGYPWHILSGKSGGLVGLLDSPASGEGTSAAFPVGAGHKKLCANEPIMVDFVSVLNGYHLDETRMFAIGSMPDKAHENLPGRHGNSRCDY